MTETEDRLRRVLHAQADDHSDRADRAGSQLTGPALRQLSHERRNRPLRPRLRAIGLPAAGISVAVAAIVVPFVLVANHNSAPPARDLRPGGDQSSSSTPSHPTSHSPVPPSPSRTEPPVPAPSLSTPSVTSPTITSPTLAPSKARTRTVSPVGSMPNQVSTPPTAPAVSESPPPTAQLSTSPRTPGAAAVTGRPAASN
jgi:hypothetical protein